MPWVRLSDDWYDDPDLIEAGPLSMLVFPLLISWSLRNLQDGRVPAGQVRRLVDWSALGAEPEQAIAPLVACGRLQAVDGGYLITNFLKYQPSREKVLGDREKDKQRKAASRGAPSASEPVAAESPQAVRPESARNPDPPDPVPGPDTSPSSSSSSDLDRLPADLWKTMGAKKAANAKVTSSAKGYARTCAENDRKDPETIARALQLVSMFDVTTSHLADCLINGTTPSPAYRRKEPA